VRAVLAKGLGLFLPIASRAGSYGAEVWLLVVRCWSVVVIVAVLVYKIPDAFFHGDGGLVVDGVLEALHGGFG